MSQAEDLLYSLKEAAAAYDFESEPCIVIGEDRFITVPESLKRIAVQYDHNIQTVTFVSPRFWDGHDMSQMKIYINCLLPNGTPSQALATNVTVSGRVMSFDWTITNALTEYKGNLAMLVCIKKTDAGGNEENHWNSELNRDLYVSEGLECTQTVVSKYPDIITQLLTRMDEVEAIATPEAMQAYTNTWLEENHATALAEIEAKGVETLASIPDDYTTVANMAEAAVRTKADGIICTAQGETIAVSDSSDDYIRGLKVFGKTTQVHTTGAQIFDYASKYKAIGAKVNDDTSEITLPSGSPSELIYRIYYGELDAGTYYISAELGTANRMRIEVFEILDDGTDTKIADSTLTAGDVELTLSLESAKNIAIKIYTLTASSDTVVNGSFKNLLISTDADAIWEPYSGGVASPTPEWPQELISVSEFKTAIYGVNIFPIREITAFGVTGVPQENGTIRYTGVATANAWETPQVCPILVSGRYTIVIETSGKTTKGSLIQHINSEGTPIDAWANTTEYFTRTFDAIAGEKIRWDIGMATNETIDATVKLMLCPGNIVHDWVPYTESQNLSLSRTLPGIPVSSGGNYTDANGQQWICDEIDFERGVYVQRVGVHTVSYVYIPGITKTDNGLKWVYGTNIVDSALHRTGKTAIQSLMNTKFQMVSQSVEDEESTGTVMSAYGHTDQLELRFRMLASEYETVDSVEQTIKGTIIQYPLATPIETHLTADEITAYRALHTNYPNTTVLNDSGATMELKYNADTKIYVDNAIKAAVAEIVSSMS